MKRILLTLIVLTISVLSSAQIKNPAHWSYSAKELNNGQVELTLTCKLDPKWHIYSQYTSPDGPQALQFTFDGSKSYSCIGKVTEPKPHEELDDVFGVMVKSFQGTVVFRQKIQRKTQGAFDVTGSLYYQLCDNGSCIAPDDVPFTIHVKAAENASAEVGDALAVNDDTADAATAEAAAAMNDSVRAAVAASNAEQAAVADAGQENDNGGGKKKGMWGAFWAAFGFGILTLFTPCVFPMIPMTINFFMHGTNNRKKNLRQAWIFGFSIIFIFAVLGLALTLLIGPDAMYMLGVHWIPNLIFFIIFVVFALSFFGLFEIKMPEKWINKSDEQADKGGFLAPFFIALTTVLVSFSCTGPILGGALIGLSTAGGSRWVNFVTLLGFGIGFASPFTMLAFFPSVLSKMKSGGWMETLKILFAFLELAFGLKFLQQADLYCGWGILDREVYLALWIAIFGLLGVYLLGKIRFKQEEPQNHVGIARFFLAIIDLAFVFYMIPGLWGAPLKGISGFLPPMESQDFNIEKIVYESASLGGGNAAGAMQNGMLPADRKYADKLELPVGFQGFYDLEEAKAYAKKVGKPIFIDFTGHTCANCREMEHYVWADPQVKKIMTQDYIICALYVDENTINLSENDWVTDDRGRILKTLGRKNLNYQKTLYQMNAQPYYVLIDGDGNTLTSNNYKYDRDVQKFIKFLEEGKKNFAK